MSKELLQQARAWIQHELHQAALISAPASIQSKEHDGETLLQILAIRSETVSAVLNESQALCTRDDDQWNHQLRQVRYSFLFFK